MKLKQFLAAALLLCSTGAWAQTDVTSTYLTNADFSQSTALTTDIFGYGKDGTPYGFQAVDGWTSVVTNGDNSNANYPNSGMAAGVLAYGSSNTLRGGQKGAPATNPNGEAAGNCFGFVGVWGCGGYYYQTVTLAAGKYTITVPMYNQSGTQANTTYTGFFPTSGTNQTVAVNPAVGSWVNQTVTFTLTADTEGQIRIGYQSTGSGSGANPHIFIDCIKIEYTAQVVRDVLETALTAANNANASLGTLDDAIATAQAVYDDDDATQDEVNAAAATLNAAVELAMSAAGDASFLIPNLGFEDCTVTTTNAAAGGSAAPVDIAGEWTQTGSASWSSSAVVEYGGTGQVNGVSAPAADNAGNTGKTLGVSVGWGGTVTYKSKAATLPAGVYTLKVNAYNAFADAQQFASKFGFVPTSGTASLSSKNSFASSTWVTDEVTFTLNEATEGVIQVGGTAVGGGSGSNAKVFFDNITVGYQSFLAGAKTAWEEAVAAANDAITNNPGVTGDELTALNEELAKAEPTTVEGYNDATTALTTATNTLIAAAPSYSAFTTAATAEYGILTYAAAAKRTALDDACNVSTPTSAADAEAKTAAIVTALRAYYESNAGAEGVEGAVDLTNKLTNAKDQSNTNGWTVTNTTGNCNLRTMSNEPYTYADGTTATGYLDTNSWGSAFASTVTQEVELYAGRYILSVKARGAETTTYQLTANGEIVDITAMGNSDGVFGRGWNGYTVEFELEETGSVALGVNFAGDKWLSFGDFQLVQLELYTEMATTQDYEDLNAAIEAAEAMALGFDEDEYAPYENVDVIKAIADAKALDQTAENPKEEVTVLIDILTNGWTANAAEVDAIFDGQFATTEANATSGDINLPGWTKVDGIRMLVKNQETDPGLAYTDGKAAVFSWGGTTLTYGGQTGYTLPLNKGELYELTLKLSGWRDGDLPSWVSFTLDESQKIVYPNNDGVGRINASESNPFVTYTAYLTPTEDNSTLQIFSNKHFAIADLSLKKAVAIDIALNEGETYTPVTEETYANVTMTRKVVAGYNTVCLPFDLTAEQVASVFGEDAKVYTFEDVPDGENSTINFNTKEGNTIAANVPVLISDATAVANTETKTVNGVILKSGDAKVAGTNFDFVGTYAPIEAIEAGDYFIGNGALYKSAGATSMKAFRAYIHDKTNGQSGVKLYIDDIETAISEINGIEAEQGVIYNIAGQRVNKAQKGIYIVNGKKVLVK